MFKYKRNLFVLLIPIIFLLTSLFTLKDYGINWDEPVHFMRGQAYLYYFLTGKQNYGEFLSSRPSIYQNRSYSVEYLLSQDSGHPPLNGIISAFFNLVFYQYLNVLGDIESYHLFNILSGFLLVAVVAVFAYRSFGFFASLVSSIVLATYPLFFAESHFNIKDPAEAAFIALSIWTFWESLSRKNLRWLLLSAIAFGFALGTKFNAIFLPFILVPYLVLRFFNSSIKKIDAGFLLMLGFYPLIGLSILYISWPYLWSDPIRNFLSVIGYYKTIGTGINYQLNQYYIFGFNIYPILWILYTTPPIVIFLSIIGIISTFLNESSPLRRIAFFLTPPKGEERNKDKSRTAALFLIWFLVPILRVTLPNTAIYGGVRQIMEYIPALSLLSGVGALALRNLLVKICLKLKFYISPLVIALLILLFFIPHLIVLVRIHPNQNVYFNFLIGGLSGAKEKNIPSWGNSYGNAYLQAIKWLNQNAGENAKVALVQGTGQNIAVGSLRGDIKFNNTFWSGIKREGEYLMELTYENSAIAYPFVWEYLDKFLEPVYEVKVDGVAIAKVWKNDLTHSKGKYKKNEIVYRDINIKNEEKILEIILNEERIITRLFINYMKDSLCETPKGIILTSKDGQVFYQEIDPYPTEFITEKEKTDNTIYYYFAGREAKVIKVMDQSKDSCIFNNPDFKIQVLEI